MYSYNFGWLADRFFYKSCFDLIYKMGPKKSRKKLRKIPTGTSSWFDLGDTAVDIQRRRKGRDQSSSTMSTNV